MKAKIRSIQLSDFGPFQGTHSFSFDGPGTYAICAPNGSGKSHIVLGTKMTASPSCELDKPMGSYVNGMGLGNKSARIEVCYDMDGEILEVSRAITLNKLPGEDELRAMLQRNELPAAGSRWNVKYKGESMRSASDAAELLGSLFGIENRIQEDSIFVMQNKAGQVIFTTPAPRSKALQFLSGAEVCQKAADIAQRRSSNMHVIDRSQELAEKEERLKGLQESIESSKKEIAESEKLLVSEQDIEQTRKRLQESQAAKDGAADYQEKKKELADFEEQLRERTSRRTALAMDQQTKQEQLDGMRTDYEAARQYVAAHASNEQLARQRNELLGEIDRLEKEPEDHPEPQAPDVPRKTIEELEQAEANLNVAVSNHQSFLEVFQETGKCPTCGSEPANVQELIQKHQHGLEEDEPQLKELRGRIRELKAAWNAYDSAAAKYKTWQDGYVSRVDAAADKLERMGDVPDVDSESLEANRKIVSEFESLQSELEKTNSDLQEVDGVLARLEAAVANHKSRCQELAAQAGRILQPEKEQEYREILSANEELKELISTQRGSVEAKEQQLTELEEEVARIREEHEKSSRKREASQFLEQLKSIMHHSAIPHDRAIVYLESINRLMASYCEILHAPFSLYVDPDTQHFMVMQDGSISPAYQLSGGQRTLAAWAWHLALYEKHGNQSGFLMMDEPTVGLDEQNLANVAEAVRHLTRYCHGSGMQFVMVTHEANLASVFDKMICIDHENV